MRIPFPERIPIWYVCAFAGLLFIIQTLQKTDPVVSLCCLVFTIVAGFAFNLAGGFAQPSGSYVFFFAILAVILGLVVKAVILEPADLNLVNARLTFEIYLAGMFTMLAAVYLNRKLRPKKGLLEGTVGMDDMRRAAIGCTIAGIGIPFIAYFFRESTDSLIAPLVTSSRQLNRFLPMAIILATTYEIKSSAGRRSINIWMILSTAAIVLQGAIISFSKEALFAPPLCWLAAGAALGYRYKRYQIIGGLLTLFFVVHYMVPYCQYGRVYRSDTATFSETFKIARGLLSDLPEVVRLYNADQSSLEDHMTAVYFNQTEGLFDRLQMISFDDALNQVTEQKGPLGPGPMIYYIQNTVPHFIWKNKPVLSTANFYGHEIGILAEDDDETAISFSPMGEAFRIGMWFGIFLLAPAVWFILFIVTDSVCGDLRKAPWGILAFAAFSHAGPEGGLGGAIYLTTYGTFIIMFVAFFSAYVMPLIASVISTPTRPAFQPFGAVHPSARSTALLPNATPPAPGA